MGIDLHVDIIHARDGRLRHIPHRKSALARIRVVIRSIHRKPFHERVAHFERHAILIRVTQIIFMCHTIAQLIVNMSDATRVLHLRSL